MANYIPVSQELHKNKHWQRHTSITFAKGDTVTPLFINDLTAALQELPIAFIKQGDHFVLVAVLGLNPGQNLYISPDGKWLANFVPAAYRSSPFELLSILGNESEKTFCIDESYVTDIASDELFFNEDGSLTDVTLHYFETVKDINTNRQFTQHVCAVLNEHNLLEPWNITLDKDGEKQSVTGLYRINEAALNSLSDEVFLILRHSHALTTAYAQLFSMQNLPILPRLIHQHQMLSSASNKKSSIENETFNFSGLS
jgi:hypothetical protein